jgi:integrase
LAGVRLGANGKSKIHPHTFRHTFAHNWKDAEGSEEDLMQIAGWKDRKVMARRGSQCGGGPGAKGSSPNGP